MNKTHLLIISVIFILAILVSVLTTALLLLPNSHVPRDSLSPNSMTPNQSPTSTPSPTPVPRATMILKITDSETHNAVDDVSVLVDGLAVGTTVQNGEIDVPNVEYGRHRVTVLVPYYEQCKVEQYVDLCGDTVVSLSINMPNPEFQVSADVKTNLEFANEYGRMSVTVSNTGQIVSQDTEAIVFVYSEDDLSTPIGTHILDFGNIAAGAQPVTKNIDRIDEFIWLKTEKIAVIVIDRWEYTPKTIKLCFKQQFLKIYLHKLSVKRHRIYSNIMK